nr:protein DBF4 homolog A [Mirounga angustirostris]
MNSGAMRIHSKGHLQGGIQVKNEKNRSLKSMKTDNKPEKSKYKPLWGKIFYIDLPSVTISEKLQKDIQDLGGVSQNYIHFDKKGKISIMEREGSIEVAKYVGKRVGIGTQKARTGRLQKPFVKVEDMSQLYRPFYLQLTNMPFINYSIQKPSSPFDVDKPSSIQKQTQVKLRIQTDGNKCGGIPIQLQLKEKKKKGYCECCLQKYDDLEAHLLSEQHRNFAQSNHYQVVDDIVSKLIFDFVEYERDMPKKKSPEEPNECDFNNMDGLPSGTIHRKVKILLGRNKKENLEPNVELDKKRTEFLITQEGNRICSSPVQSLLDLFQTSEEKSEFLGFTSYTENSGICDVLDIWEEENSNNLLSVFFSSPSTSTFTGF